MPEMKLGLAFVLAFGLAVSSGCSKRSAPSTTPEASEPPSVVQEMNIQTHNAPSSNEQSTEK